MNETVVMQFPGLQRCSISNRNALHNSDNELCNLAIVNVMSIE